MRSMCGTFDIARCGSARGRAYRRARISALAVAAVLLGVAFGASAARAAEPSAGACVTFCAPVEQGKLDNMRAQGLDGTADANIRLSVILWDETRRQTQPATGGAAGASVSLPGPMPVSLTSGGALGSH